MFVGKVEGEPYNITRSKHHERSAEYIRQNAGSVNIPIDQWQLPNIIDICRAHRSKVNFNDNPKIPKERIVGDRIVRVQLLASLLRIADACDIDSDRAPESIFQNYKEFIPKISIEHWKKHFKIGTVIFNWEKACVEIPMIFPTYGTEEYYQQYILANKLRDELLFELRSIEDVFEEYSVGLYHIVIKDYNSNKYIIEDKCDNNNLSGWFLSNYSNESQEIVDEALLLKPLVTYAEIEKCYVSTSIIDELKDELIKDNFSCNYLFIGAPRTGKTSLLAYLSNLAVRYGYNVFWFTKIFSIPGIDEFIRELSKRVILDQHLILVFDNIHECKEMLGLIENLINSRKTIHIWCTSRLDEFVNISDYWAKISINFIVKEIPRYLDEKSVLDFLKVFDRSLNDEIKRLILARKDLTPYDLAEIYQRLKPVNNETDDPIEIIKELFSYKNQGLLRQFIKLSDIEKFILKIVAYFTSIPEKVLRDIIEFSSTKDNVKIVEQLIANNLLFKQIAQNGKTEEISMFDYYRDYVINNAVRIELEYLPNIFLDYIRSDAQYSALAMIILCRKFSSLRTEQRQQISQIVIERKENRRFLCIGSYLAKNHGYCLELSDYVMENSDQICPVIISNFGDGFLHTKDFDNVIKMYDEAIKHDQQNAQFYHSLGHLYELIGNYREAINNLRRATEIDREYVVCFLRVLCIENEINEIKKYIDLIRNNSKLTAKELNGLAYNLICLDLFDEVKIAIDEGMMINKDYNYLYATKGMLYLRLGQIDYGNSLYQQSINMDPQDTPLQQKYHFEYGKALRKHREFERALKEFTRALELDADYVPRHEICNEIDLVKKKQS